MVREVFEVVELKMKQFRSSGRIVIVIVLVLMMLLFILRRLL